MVFNATCNNISVISWRSVLLVEETGVPGENHQPVTTLFNISMCQYISSTILCLFCYLETDRNKSLLLSFLIRFNSSVN